MQSILTVSLYRRAAAAGDGDAATRIVECSKLSLVARVRGDAACLRAAAGRHRAAPPRQSCRHFVFRGHQSLAMGVNSLPKTVSRQRRS